MKGTITRSLRKLVSIASKTFAQKYIQKDRWYHYKELRLKVLKDVFHPGLFRSSKMFAAWIEQQELQGKKVLEIGSGSGLISLIAAKKGAIVTAVDINEKAVENTKLNAALNRLNVTAILSDLFENITFENFDLIFINPPYYPKQPQSDYEKAWYCGKDFDYFRRLFSELNNMNYQNKCVMILSDTCDLSSIIKIAGDSNIRMIEIASKNIAGEKLIIYQTGSTVPA